MMSRLRSICLIMLLTVPNSCMLGNLSWFCCRLLTFQNLLFQQKITKTIWVSSGLCRSWSGSKLFGLNLFYLYTLFREQHIKTYSNIQYTNGIQKKVFRLIRICIPFKISILLILSRFWEKPVSVPMLNFVLKCTARVWKLINYK